MPLFPEGFAGVGGQAEEDLGYGLGGVGKGCIDDAHFHRDAVDCREGQADDEVEGTDSARDRDGEAQSPDQGEEEGVYKVETFEEGSSPDCGCSHEPVKSPDESCVGKEQPFALHAETARESLTETSEDAPDLAAEGVGITVTP